MKLLNRNNLAVRFAASKEENRYTLRAILATENETVATDGHIMCRVSLPNVAAEQFPTVEGFAPNGFTRGLIPLDAAKDIENAIPNAKKTFPVLKHAAITTEHTEGQRDTLKVATTDLETPKVFTVRQPEGSFPQWDGSIWPTDAPVMDICFNANLLANLSIAAARFSDRTNMIRLRFYSPCSAMRFDVVNDDGQEMNGLLMPARASVQPTFKERKPAVAEPEPEPEPEPVAEPEPVEPEPVAAVADFTTNELDSLCPQCGEEDCTCQPDWANGVNDALRASAEMGGDLDTTSDADSGL